MEDITDADYMHAKKVWKDFEIKNLGEDHDLYVQSDTLLLPDVFGSFRNKCIDIHIYNIWHWSAHFLPPSGFVMID